jgi:hypothetical protein
MKLIKPISGHKNSLKGMDPLTAPTDISVNVCRHHREQTTLAYLEQMAPEGAVQSSAPLIGLVDSRGGHTVESQDQHQNSNAKTSFDENSIL